MFLVRKGSSVDARQDNLGGRIQQVSCIEGDVQFSLLIE